MIESVVVTVFPVSFLILLFGGGALLRRRNIDLAGTPFDPHKPASALITDGPYRFSRNPAYVTLTLWYVGIGLLLNNGWVLLLVLLPLLVMDRCAIPREERHLEAEFGEEYRRYKSTVRRWL